MAQMAASGQPRLDSHVKVGQPETFTQQASALSVLPSLPFKEEEEEKECTAQRSDVRDAVVERTGLPAPTDDDDLPACLQALVEPDFSDPIGAHDEDLDTGFIDLRGGLVLPVAAIDLAVELKWRGVHLSVGPQGTLIAEPGCLLTEDDRARIRRWKWHLQAIVTYAPPEGQ